MRQAGSLQSGGRTLIARLRVADRPWSRAVGLLGRRELPQGEGLWIRPCGSIHTFFMKFPIDVFFLDREGVVVSLRREFTPGRVLFGGPRAHSVLEIQSGWLPPEALGVGDRVECVE